MLTEAERQALIALIELDEPVETPNNNHYSFYPTDLEAAATYFYGLREDWGEAYESLAAGGWLAQEPDGWALTEAGRAAARQERQDHPPIWYWYRVFYPLAARSGVYGQFCQQLYGRDLRQAGFSDMAQMELLLKVGGLGRESRVLDLGCGLGYAAEYLSDESGARMWGLDYTPEAVALANARTANRRERLAFVEGNLDALNFPAGGFDCLVSIDTLYMPSDLPATLRAMRNLLAPGGQMLVYYSAFAFDPAGREALEADCTPLARGLQAVGLAYQTWDVTENTFQMMRRKARLAEDFREAFEAEGSGICTNSCGMRRTGARGRLTRRGGL